MKPSDVKVTLTIQGNQLTMELGNVKEELSKTNMEAQLEGTAQLRALANANVYGVLPSVAARMWGKFLNELPKYQLNMIQNNPKKYLDVQQ